MTAPSEVQELVVDAANKVAELPIEKWSGWAVYLLEILDGKGRGRHRPIWLDDIRDSINDRMTHGRW